MTSRASRLVEVRASGSPRQLGTEYGEAVAPLAHEVLEMRMGWCARGSSRSGVLAKARTYLPFVEDYAPELVEELEGLATGAEMSFDEALFLQVASELDQGPEDGCSAIGSSVGGEGPLIAQNWDTAADYLGKEVVVHLAPTRGPEIMMFAPAGVIGYIGMNAAGVGHVNNSVYLPSRPLGLTGYFVTRKLLGFSSLRAGLTWLKDVPLGSGASYMMGDRSGEIIDVELSGGSFKEIVKPLQGHTNHYLQSPLGATRGTVQAMLMKPDSLDRMLRLEAVLGGGDETAVRAALRDHEGHPQSICRHEGAAGTRTTASVILRLARLEMLVCAGNPCEEPYHCYALGAR